jgi:hypothetical protein
MAQMERPRTTLGAGLLLHRKAHASPVHAAGGAAGAVVQAGRAGQRAAVWFEIHERVGKDDVVGPGVAALGGGGVHSVGDRRVAQGPIARATLLCAAALFAAGRAGREAGPGHEGDHGEAGERPEGRGEGAHAHFTSLA